ncbi:MAG: CHASE2 domain-containing sensor protein/signal transduction histidine kinase [Patiriisocius sp.]|jgi:CHASE2 domain-containing sensor protein/signal transduction histidine kinase
MAKTSGSGQGQRRITLAGLLVFFCTLLFLVWLLQWSAATLKVDRLLHDSWVRSYQRDVPEDVVIAAIDSPSLAQLGRWPWSRDLQAQLFEQLKLMDARAVVVDLLYVEPSIPAEDSRLAKAIGSHSVSILPVLTEGGRARVASESLPIPIITRQVTDLGHIFLPIDDDGIVRRVFLKSGFSQAHWPALSLAALQALGDMPAELPGLAKSHDDQVGQWVENHEIMIPFFGLNGAFQRISAFDIINADVSKSDLAGKIVFIGMTTTGLGDVVPTPVSALDQPVPGVEIHATIFAALRDQSLVTKAPHNTNIVVALVLLPLMLLLYSRMPPQWGFLSAVVGAGLPVLLSFLLYRYGRLWYAPLAASVPVLISYLFWSWHRLAYINRFLEREQAKLAPHIPRRDSQSNALLADFFTTASRHLPLRGWRFRSGDEEYVGGTGLPDTPIISIEGSWRYRDGVYTRTYPSAVPLSIEIVIEDSEHGAAVTHYVDTLARVQSRERASKLAGSIEKLQTDALQLSEQMDWLRSIKVFSETILDGSPTGFGVWNAAGECVRANQLIYQMVPAFDNKADFIDFLMAVGRRFGETEDDELLRQLLLECKAWQVPYSDGEKELVVNFSAVGDTLAERLICASVLDVSQIRTAERARAEMVDYLSHDLRSPLISALALLEEDSDSRIEHNIQHSLTMMDDLLHVARADSLTEAKFSEVLLNDVLDNALDQMLPQAMSRAISFELDVSDDDLWVDGDAASLERAFTNILSNAIKYSPDDTAIRVKLYGSGRTAILMIDDEGVGIDPAMLGQLFTRFKRDAFTESNFKGIGLGLALVSRVVTLHGGNVVASNLPQGTRITFLLPLESESNEDAGG